MQLVQVAANHTRQREGSGLRTIQKQQAGMGNRNPRESCIQSLGRPYDSDALQAPQLQGALRRDLNFVRLRCTGCKNATCKWHERRDACERKGHRSGLRGSEAAMYAKHTTQTQVVEYAQGTMFTYSIDDIETERERERERERE